MKIIKKYNNRKLYDSTQKKHISLMDLAKLIREDQEIKVIDHKTKSDITYTTLIHLLFELEKKAIDKNVDLLIKVIKKGTLLEYIKTTENI